MLTRDTQANQPAKPAPVEIAAEDDAPLEVQNQKLRNQLLDLELKQRDYITKILDLQTQVAISNAQASNENGKKRPSIDIQGADQKGPGRDQSSAEEKKFCEVIIKTYSELFGITSLKDIWKRHKQILGDWMLHEGNTDRKSKS